MNTYTKLAAAVLLAVTATAATAEKGDIIVHTGSVHIGVDGMNNVNPGIGYDVTDNFRIGALYNSYRKPSAYVAGFINFPPDQDRVRVGAGLISGYTFTNDDSPEAALIEGKTTGMVPLVAVEVDIIKKRGNRPGVSAVWFGQAVNLEIKF